MRRLFPSAPRRCGGGLGFEDSAYNRKWKADKREVLDAHAYLVITIFLAAMAAFSARGKIRREPRQVRVIHQTVGVPLKYFPLLAACEFAGAVGLVFGIWWSGLGVAAAIGLVIYFVGAVASHLWAGNAKGIGPAFFMLVVSAAALARFRFKRYITTIVVNS
jgi:hypothetical protein